MYLAKSGLFSSKQPAARCEPAQVPKGPAAALRQLPAELWQAILAEVGPSPLEQQLCGANLGAALAPAELKGHGVFASAHRTVLAQMALSRGVREAGPPPLVAPMYCPAWLSPYYFRDLINGDAASFDASPAIFHAAFAAAHKQNLAVIAEEASLALRQLKVNDEQQVFVWPVANLFSADYQASMPCASKAQRDAFSTLMRQTKDSLRDLDLSGTNICLFFPADWAVEWMPYLAEEPSNLDAIGSRRNLLFVDTHSLRALFGCLSNLRILRLRGKQTHEVALLALPLKTMQLDVLDVSGASLNHFDWLDRVAAKRILLDDLSRDSTLRPAQWGRFGSVSSRTRFVSALQFPAGSQGEVANIVQVLRQLPPQIKVDFSASTKAYDWAAQVRSAVESWWR